MITAAKCAIRIENQHRREKVKAKVEVPQIVVQVGKVEVAADLVFLGNFR